MTASGSMASVFVDADNTLWDTDAVYAEAQLSLLSAVEKAAGISPITSDRLAFVREIDQQLAERHHQGLRYPPRLLVRSIIFASMGFAPARAARNAWLGEVRSPLSDQQETELEQGFIATISKSPALRPGVVEGLDRLLEAGCSVLIVTESAEAKALATAQKLGLNGHFTRIIEGKKRPELYERIVRLTHGPIHAFMVGDQLDRDIAPAKVAGLTTIYFPGGFKPKWMPDEAKVKPDFRIASFAEVPGIVMQALASDPLHRQAV